MLCGVLLLVGCSTREDAGSVELSVYAASSLSEAFGEMESLFERAHPQVDVRLVFAGSQILRLQIEEGAPADVFASADPVHMGALTRAGLVTEVRVFAANELVVVVPFDNPAGVASFADLPKATRIVLGTPEVPVGRYAREALAAASTHLRSGFAEEVLARVASEEPNVRLARSKVEMGEADAAIVYRTDALGAEGLSVIPVPSEMNVRAEYLIGAIAGKRRSPPAEAWIELVTSPEGRGVMERHGFLVD